jgi:gluconolactonase
VVDAAPLQRGEASAPPAIAADAGADRAADGAAARDTAVPDGTAADVAPRPDVTFASVDTAANTITQAVLDKLVPTEIPNAPGAPMFGALDGVLWIPRQQVLIFHQATPVSHMYKLTPPSTISDFPAAALGTPALDPDGTLVVADGKRIVRLKDTGEMVEVIATSFANVAFNGANGVVVRRDGTIYATDTRSSEYATGKMPGRILRIRPDASHTTALVANMSQPTGIALSPDQQTLYVSDFHDWLIQSFKVAADGTTDAGTLFAKHDLGRYTEAVCVDDAANVYMITHYGFLVFTSTGQYLGRNGRVDEPAKCSFGGKDRKTLYITGSPRTPGLPVLHAFAMPIPGLP